MDNEAREIAEGLTPNQLALFEDLCRCPDLFAGQYIADGAGIEHLPQELVSYRYEGAAGLLGLAKASPSATGLRVRTYLEQKQ